MSREQAIEAGGASRLNALLPGSCSGSAAEPVKGLRELLHSVRGANEVENVDPRRKRGRGLAGDGGLLESYEGGESAKKVVPVHAGTVGAPAASRLV